MATLSIITAFLNEAKNQPKFAERVLAMGKQRDYQIEIVLVDDHSTDASSEIAKKWAAEDPRVT